jgi:phosphoenolpyruvate synthase/pyruvate phosphate dikinase
VSVLSLQDGPPGDVALVGGKARGLADLIGLGLPVPPAAVLTTEAHERFREQGAVAHQDRLALVAAVEELGEPLAVRSSAADEDAGDRSAAGQYDSVMGLRGAEAVVAAVEQCWRAAESGRAHAYREGAPPSVALVLQRQVAADRAAVRARVADKAGAADGSGNLVPLARERRHARTLRDDEARAVADVVTTAERGLGLPVDIEFCFAGDELWAVQCRPITTLS